MYDVLYLNRTHGKQVLARELDHDAACEFARRESQRRGVGRMFLAGSELNPPGDMILIVESTQHPA